MYDRAAKITSKSVSTSNVFIGHHPLFHKTRGHLTIGTSHPFSLFNYYYSISQNEQMFNDKRIILLPNYRINRTCLAILMILLEHFKAKLFLCDLHLQVVNFSLFSFDSPIKVFFNQSFQSETSKSMF